jgi:hypothetical protein
MPKRANFLAALWDQSHLVPLIPKGRLKVKQCSREPTVGGFYPSSWPTSGNFRLMALLLNAPNEVENSILLREHLILPLMASPLLIPANGENQHDGSF